MDGASSPGSGLDHLLLHMLAQPEARQSLRNARAEGQTGFARAGLFVGLLGFAQSEREPSAKPCKDAFFQQNLCTSAQAVGQGGLLWALALGCLLPPPEQAVGCAIVLPAFSDMGVDGTLAIEQQLLKPLPGSYVVGIWAERQADARLLASASEVPLWPIGRTSGKDLILRTSAGGADFQEILRLPIAALRAAADLRD